MASGRAFEMKGAGPQDARHSPHMAPTINLLHIRTPRNPAASFASPSHGTEFLPPPQHLSSPPLYCYPLPVIYSVSDVTYVAPRRRRERSSRDATCNLGPKVPAVKISRLLPVAPQTSPLSWSAPLCVTHSLCLQYTQRCVGSLKYMERRRGFAVAVQAEIQRSVVLADTRR